jgi:xanthine dehydrogenase accessory factor
MGEITIMQGQILEQGLLAVATCIETNNMNLAKAGQKRIFLPDRQEGTLGEAWLDVAIEELLTTSYSGSFTVQRISGPAGSWARVMLEVYGPKKELIILGGGHIAKWLAKLGKFLDYQVTVVDNRPEYATADRFGDDTRVICCPYSNLNEHITFGNHTSVVVATHGHQYDLVCLDIVLRYNLPYVGAVGSRRKQALVKERLASSGLSLEKILKLHLPAGLDIGAETPAEIALSIAAELSAKQRQGSGVSLSELVSSNQVNNHKKRVLVGEAPDIDLLQQAVLYGQKTKLGALATVVKAGFSTPRKAGAKMLVTKDGATVGTIGGGLVEAAVKEEAEYVMTKQVPCLREFSLRPTPEQNLMVCGGDMEVFVEPLVFVASLLTKEDLTHAKLS